VLTQAVLMRRIAKRFRDQSIAQAGLVIQTCAYSLIAFAKVPLTMFVATSLSSVGVGITTPALSGIVSNSVSDSEQGVMLGTVQSVTAVTRIIGPLWAGFVFDWLGPGAPYWSGAVFIGIAAVLIMGAKPQQHQHA